MNAKLEGLVDQFINDPDKYENAGLLLKIRDMEPTEADFDDRFFGAFDAQQRLEIYVFLAGWVDASAWLKILECRLESEVDWNCKKRIRSLLKCFERRTKPE